MRATDPSTAKVTGATPLRMLTCNNLSCYYRKKKQLKKARMVLQQALQLTPSAEERAKCISHQGVTHSNLCAVLSQMGQHKVAMHHAENAVRCVRQEVAAYDGREEEQLEKEPLADKLMMLAVSLYNLGVEQEFLGLSCLASYKEAIDTLAGLPEQTEEVDAFRRQVF